MSRLLYRLGGAAAAHPWRTLAAWLIVLLTAVGLSITVGGTNHDDYNVPGTSSQRGTDLLRDRFPAMSGTDARVVVHSDDGAALDRAVLDRVRERLADMPGASVVGPPRMSSDGDTALISVQYDIPVTDFQGTEGVDALESAAKPATDDGLQVDFGGQVPENEGEVGGTAEAIGLAAALVILLVAFGSVLAAGMPLLVALFGLGVGSAGVTLLAAVTDVSTSSPTVASMVGIGVGIDYALLLVTRHVEGLRRGLSVHDAAATATATSGLSVVFAGATVLLSLFGLSFSGLAVFRSFGYATAIVVATVVVSSLTLVPALCGLLGRRLLPRKERRGRRTSRPVPLTARWASRVGARPWPYAIGALVVLLALAAPVLGMRTWPQDAGSQPESNTTRRAYDLIAAEYGEGANGPLLVAVDLDKFDRAGLPSLATRLDATPGVEQVAPPVLSPAGDAAVITVEPSYGPQDERASELVDTIRADVLPGGAEVTGVTAVFADIVDLLSERLWLVIGIVVSLSLLLLIVVFRSIAVPVKAAVVNLLSIGAAYGVITAVFQWGWGASLVGLDHSVAVSSWVPLIMFSVLFGLSMDYEVFLLSRIREDYQATRDATGSVVRGLAATGRVITSAAMIMVAVFLGFGADTDVTVKMIGIGMATAVAVDATLVRMVLVPATMSLLGKANWWLPKWLDRILPQVDVHGPDDTVQPPAEQELAAAR
jgi:RND superfamily putative drug exporter